MKKVLIVEDDLTNRNLLKALVEKKGVMAMMSPNGRHALEVLDVDPDVAVLVCDYQMPEMTGRDLIEALIERGRYIPTIVVSGVVSVHDISDLLESGADFFLPKPLNPTEFFEYLDSCLRKDPGHTSGAHRVVKKPEEV